MDLSIVIDLINGCGFPIACVVAMFYTLSREREAHKQESDRWTEALNNNTLIMQRLYDKLEGDRKDG